MAENATYGYRAMLHTQGAAWVLMVNDIYVREAGDTQYADYTTNITTHLKAGTNTVSLLFSPIVGQDPTTGDYLYELYDAVALDISIERSDYRSGATETVHPVRMKYDEAAAGFTDLAKTFGGEDRVMATPNMRVVGEMQFYELTGKDIVFDAGQAVGGYRLDITFEISDPIPGFHWESEAVTLQDTPEMRRGLREAYRRVHATISRGDGEAIFREMEPIWERTAYLMTSKGSAREFIENSDAGLAQYQQSGPNGDLQPLQFSDQPGGDQLQFMARNRLVWIRPLKIYWVDDDQSPSHTLFPVVFYQRADGTWRIASVETGT